MTDKRLKRTFYLSLPFPRARHRYNRMTRAKWIGTSVQHNAFPTLRLGWTRHFMTQQATRLRRLRE